MSTTACLSKIFSGKFEFPLIRANLKGALFLISNGKMVLEFL